MFCDMVLPQTDNLDVKWRVAEMDGLKKYIRSNYHWVIVAVAFLESIVFGGILNSYGIYVIPITEGLGISRGLYSTIGIGQGIMTTISTMMTTILFRRFGYRKVLSTSVGILGLSMVITSVAANPWLYGISKILFGIGYGACHTAGAAWIVKSWFHKHYGLVLGIITMGTGLGGSIFSVFMVNVMEASNWRWAHVLSAGLLVAVMLLILLLQRDTPERIGLKPYGEGQLYTKDAIKKQQHKNWPGISVEETKRNPAYFLMNLSVFLACICVLITSAVLVPFFRDNGYSSVAAAKYQSVYMFSLAITKLLCGWVSEKIGGKALGIICVACAAVGQFGLAGVAGPGLAYIFVVIFSVSLTMTSVTLPLLTQSVFGTETSTSIMGMILGVASFGGLIGEPVSNWCHDIMGSYTPVFRLAAVMDIVVIGLLLVVFWIFGVKEKQYKKAKIG